MEKTSPLIAGSSFGATVAVSVTATGSGSLVSAGSSFDVPSVVDRAHDEVVLERAAKAAGGKVKLPRKAVVEALATGIPPDGTGPALLRLLEAASDAEALAIVRAVSAGTGQPPKAVWKHGRALAARLGCARPVWQHGKD